MDVESFQTALRLPRLENYFETLSEEKFKFVREGIGYIFSIHGTSHDPHKYTIHQCFGV